VRTKAGASGVLTCGHVASDVLSKAEVGLVTFPEKDQFQSAAVRCNQLTPVILGSPPYEPDEPDLAFLQLPDDVLGRLPSGVLSVSFERQLEKQAEPANSLPIRRAVVGLVGEWTEAAVVTATTEKTPMWALINVGEIAREWETNEYDFCSFTPTPEAGFMLPNSYACTSGGGLWQFQAREAKIDTTIDAKLIGVALRERMDGRLVCHGSNAIFDKLASELRTNGMM